MVKHSKMGDFGAAWLQDHGLPVGPETLGVSSRVRRAALRLQMQSDEPVVAGRGPTKTVTLTMLRRGAEREERSGHAVESEADL